MSSHALVTPRVYLADLWRASLARDAFLVLGGTAFIALCALVIIPLPFTPVPIALSTFAVLVTSASLGSLRGALSAGLYLLIGAMGAPIFSGGQSGVMFPTFGYVVGFVAASVVVGELARHQADRRVITTVALGALGTLVLYVCGVPWLALSLGIDLGQAVVLGVVPFLAGDAVKVLALSALMPSAWRFANRIKPEANEGGR